MRESSKLQKVNFEIFVINLSNKSWVILDFYEPALKSYFRLTRQPAPD